MVSRGLACSLAFVSALSGALGSEAATLYALDAYVTSPALYQVDKRTRHDPGRTGGIAIDPLSATAAVLGTVLGGRD